MFEPEKLLEDLDLDRLTMAQAIHEIRRLSMEVLPDMSPHYYQQRLGAIAILAGIASDRLKR